MSNWKAALLIVVPLVVGACAGAAYGQPAGQTSMPGMTIPASAPQAAATPLVGSNPPAVVSPSASAGATLHIAALNIAFDTNRLHTSAGQPFTIEFANNDPGVPHNIDILDASGNSIFKGEIVTGPTTISYELPALAPGTYPFHCDVHPTMTGTLTLA